MTSDGVGQDGVGEPDAFERLWTPHRVRYIKGEGKPSTSDAVDCPFCRIPAMDDAEGLIVHRGEHELCAGFDHLGEDRDPPRKLSADEVERMCGRPLRVIG